MGEDGGDGKQGLPGHNGKRGGDSVSFHLKAFELSEFHLTSIQNSPGTGSKGSKGSLGGKKGRNGKDRKKLCNVDLPYPERGRKGKKGPRGKDGENGKKGTVCLEKLFNGKRNSFGSEREESVICY